MKFEEAQKLYEELATELNYKNDNRPHWLKGISIIIADKGNKVMVTVSDKSKYQSTNPNVVVHEINVSYYV